MKKIIDNKLRCSFCGKFIKTDNIAHTYFTPDSHFTYEELLLECKKCGKTKENENKKII